MNGNFLWSDERIDSEYNQAADEYDDKRVLYAMRDEYQARIAELERRLAQAWQPVEDEAELDQIHAWIMYAGEEPDGIRLCRRITREIA